MTANKSVHSKSNERKILLTLYLTILTLLFLLLFTTQTVYAMSENNPPSVTILEPYNGKTITTTSNYVEIYLKVKATDDRGLGWIFVYVDGKCIDFTTCSGKKDYTYETKVPLTPGTHKITVKAIDKDNAESSSKSVKVTVVKSNSPTKHNKNTSNTNNHESNQPTISTISKNNPPSVTILEPYNGKTITTTGNTAKVLVRARITDDYGLFMTLVLVDGHLKDLITESRKTITYEKKITLSPGTHTITVKAYDESGMSSEKSVRVKVVKNSPPSVTIPEPYNGKTITTTSNYVEIYLKVKATDDRGLGWIFVYIDGKCIDFTTCSGKKDYTYETKVPLTPGTHKITVKAIDKDNAESSKSVKVTVVKSNSLTKMNENTGNTDDHESNQPTISITPEGDPYFTGAGLVMGTSFHIDFKGEKTGLIPYIDTFDVKGHWNYAPDAPGTLNDVVTVVLYDESGKTVTKAKFLVKVIHDTHDYVKTKFVEGDSRISLTFDGWYLNYEAFNDEPRCRAYAQDFKITAKYEKGIDHLIVKRSSGRFTWIKIPGSGQAFSKVIDCKGRTTCTTTATLLTKDGGSVSITVELVGTDGKHYTVSKTIRANLFNQVHKPFGTLTITGTGTTTKTYDFTYSNLPSPCVTLYAKKTDPTFGKVASATVKIVTYSDDSGYYQYELIVPSKYEEQKKEINRNTDYELVCEAPYCPSRPHLLTTCGVIRLNKLPPGSYVLSVTFREISHSESVEAVPPTYSYTTYITLNVLDYVNPKDVTVKITPDEPPLLAKETSATITITKPSGHVALSIYRSSRHLADLTCTNERCEYTIKIPVDGLPNVAGAVATVPLTLYVNGEKIVKNVVVKRGEGFEPNTEITLSYLVTKKNAGPLKTIRLDYDGKQYYPTSVSRSLRQRGDATGTVTFKVKTSDKTSIAYLTTCDDGGVCDSKPVIIPIHLSTAKPRVCSVDLHVTTNVRGCLDEGEMGYVTVTASTNGNCKIKRLDFVLTTVKGEKTTDSETYDPPRQYVTRTTSFSAFSGTITITATTDTGLKKSYSLPVAVCSTPPPVTPTPKPTRPPTPTTPKPTPKPTVTPTLIPTPTPTISAVDVTITNEDYLTSQCFGNRGWIDVRFEVKSYGSKISYVKAYVDGLSEKSYPDAVGKTSYSGTFSLNLNEFSPGSKHTVKIEAGNYEGKTDYDTVTIKICQIVTPTPTPTATLSKYYLPLYEASGSMAQGGATYCAIKDKSGNYHLILVTNMPTVGEYWTYKILSDPSTISAMKVSKDILVINPDRTLHIYWYDEVKGSLLATEKVPSDIAEKILKDIQNGIYDVKPLP